MSPVALAQAQLRNHLDDVTGHTAYTDAMIRREPQFELGRTHGLRLLGGRIVRLQLSIRVGLMHKLRRYFRRLSNQELQQSPKGRLGLNSLKQLGPQLPQDVLQMCLANFADSESVRSMEEVRGQIWNRAMTALRVG